MARTRKIQTSFSAGELSAELSFRRDTAQYNAGAKALRNCRLLISGGFKRRPGTRWLQQLAGDARIVEFVASGGTSYIVAFGPGRMDAFLPDGTAAGGLTGCPWTGSIWREMGWEQQADVMFLTHPVMRPHVLRRLTLNTWTVEPFTFLVSGTGATKQPYLKIAPPEVTLQPSARTGAVTLTLSAGWWGAGNVGQIVRYSGREILVNSVTSPTVATGTVIEELPPTADIDVANVEGFRVGDLVQGPDSGARGIVVAVSSPTLTVVQTDQQSQFTVDEILVGPTAQSAVVSVGVASSLGALTDWDEALFTPALGYPSCVALHRNRLCFAGHPAVGTALIASQTDKFQDFDIGTGGDAEGIFVLLGDGVASTIRHLVSSEQLLLLTDAGPYYVPEGPQLPFRPTSVGFQRFGSKWPASPLCRPQLYDDGVLMVSGSLAIMLRPTGNASNRQWEADEVSLLSSHLLRLPFDTAVTENFAGGPERYALLLNEDGTLAAMMLVSAQEIRNMTPWDTTGVYRSMAALAGDIYAVVRRTINGSEVYLLEQFDDGLTVDAAGEYLDLGEAAARYGTTEVQVIVGNYALGTLPVADPPPGPYTVGMDYTLRAETFPPFLEGIAGGGAGQDMRLTEVFVHVLSSARFGLQGQTLTAYQIGDDITQPPPLRSYAAKFRLLGWRKDPTLTITQAEPLPLTVLGVSMEVAI